VGFVQTVWQEGAAQPARLPDDDMPDDVAEPAIAGNESARGLAALLPSLRGKEMERHEPRLGAAAGHLGEKTDLNAASAGESTPAAELGQEDRRKLQAVLHELSECRRLLDGVLR
jgi:hypothetical protein